MLSEIMFASVNTKREQRGDRVPGLSCSGLHPCPYRMYKVSIGEVWSEELEPKQVLNMSDGWDQEEQAIKRLKAAGITIENRQGKVRLGRTEIPGSFDGTVKLDGIERLWEFKAMNSNRFWELKNKGIGAFLGYKAQVNAYMLGWSLEECIFQAKYKDENDYYDCIVKLDRDFILPIIESADKIREGNIPEPVQCGYCSSCGIGCFGEAIDMGWIKKANASEQVEKWKKGNVLAKVGTIMKDEAKSFFVGYEDSATKEWVPGLIGDEDTLIVEDLKVQKVIQHRWNIDRHKIIEVYGPEGFLKVSEPKDITMYQIREV